MTYVGNRISLKSQPSISVLSSPRATSHTGCWAQRVRVACTEILCCQCETHTRIWRSGMKKKQHKTISERVILFISSIVLPFLPESGTVPVIKNRASKTSSVLALMLLQVHRGCGKFSFLPARPFSWILGRCFWYSQSKLHSRPAPMSDTGMRA